MANPVLPGIPQAEQDLLYQKLNEYNRGRVSYKEGGAYLVVLPRQGHPSYTLWVYSPLPERRAIFYICDLSEEIREALRMASTLCFYSPRSLAIVEYNTKRMQSRGDDIVSFGKYHGHFLHEVFRIDPQYLSWIVFKFQPRIPKQERFVLIAKIYYSVYLDMQRRKAQQKHDNRFLGVQGGKVENLALTVTGVRVEDNPYKTQVRQGTPLFYVRQLLQLKDEAGNWVSMEVNARTASRESCRLPSAEHAYQAGETVRIASARIARTYLAGSRRCTRLTHVKLAQEKEGVPK